MIGGGWIGLEVTAAARQAGLQVTVLENLELPLLRVLGREMAQVFADLHRSHGVSFRLGVRVEGISGGSGTAASVRLADGTRIEATPSWQASAPCPASAWPRRPGLRSRTAS